MAKRRWSSTEATITSKLRALAKRMGAKNVRVEKALDETGGGAIVWFDRDDRRFRATLDRFPFTMDNFYGLVEALRCQYMAFEILAPTIQEIEAAPYHKQAAMRTQAAARFAQEFGGYLMTPDDPLVLRLGTGTGRRFWEVLGVAPNATKEEITAAYRALARYAHPDKGGSDARMAELNAAYAEGTKGK